MSTSSTDESESGSSGAGSGNIGLLSTILFASSLFITCSLTSSGGNSGHFLLILWD